MISKSFRLFFINIPAFFALCLFLNAPVQAQKNKPAEKTAADLFREFGAARRLPCGQRDEAIRIARLLLEKYPSELEADLKEGLKKQIVFLEEFEQYCQNGNSAASLETIYDQFKTARKMPCGRRDRALFIGKEIIQNYADDQTNREVIEWVKKQIPLIEKEDKECKSYNSLENLFEEFKNDRKRECGQRAYAVSVGKKILALHGGDEENQEVIRYVEREVPKIEEQDRICQRNDSFNQAYRAKNWSQVFAIGKQIIEEERNSPLALDLMLGLAEVGYDLTAYRDNNSYNSDAVFYAKKAIEMIEDGVVTEGCWGIVRCYRSKDKALAWMNYIIGYIMYFRDKEGKKAVPYFYKATRYQAEFKYDAFVYQAVAIYYFDREAVTPSNLTVNDFIFRAQTLVNPAGERTGNYFDSADNEIILLYKNLVNLYNLRYNLTENENPSDLANYIQILINKPLIDPSAGVKKRK